jgi:hypothetical protein
MAWRPNEQFIEGELDNSVPGKVTGWMRFTGKDEKVIIDLDGNFHRDIRGAKIRLKGDGESADIEESKQNMEGFATIQKGQVGDMTAGREPSDYVKYGYFEWYGDYNGRVTDFKIERYNQVSPDTLDQYIDSLNEERKNHIKIQSLLNEKGKNGLIEMQNISL